MSRSTKEWEIAETGLPWCGLDVCCVHVCVWVWMCVVYMCLVCVCVCVCVMDSSVVSAPDS